MDTAHGGGQAHLGTKTVHRVGNLSNWLTNCEVSRSRTGIREVGNLEVLQTEQYQNQGPVRGICHCTGSEVHQREDAI